MLRRLVRSPAVFLALFSLLALFIAPRNYKFTMDAATPAPEAKHGLTGSYYTMTTTGWYSDTPPDLAEPANRFVQFWIDRNDFRLPKSFMDPVATRVDPQVAFGNGKGFVPQNGQQVGWPTPRQLMWWPKDYPLPGGWPWAARPPWEAQGAVIWRGYIHLPKAGAYYFATISDGPSAVYLNKARVALNGVSAGVLVAEAFNYAKEVVHDYVQNVASGREDLAFQARPAEIYVVPVPIDAPRDVPIEVQYLDWGYNGIGIDLFWVTPDAPRDASGKPIAQIVPSEALYTEAPGPIEKPAVRSANSTISAEFFYFPVQSTDQAVPLTIRLADKDGNPVAGKRVHVSSTVSGGFADTIIQPEKPTDENGVTTAKIRGGEGYKVTHDSAIFATDVTDLVDAAQVAHVAFQDVFNSFFLFPEHTFSGQYDGGKIFSVDPLPLRVGRPTKIEVPLINRAKFATEPTATFLAKGWNIGGGNWNEIGKVKGVRLRPGESTKVSIIWTPDAQTEHVCLKIDVNALVIAQNQSQTPAFASAFFPTPVLADDKPQGAQIGSMQQNIGPVEPCIPPSPADPTMFGLPGVNFVESRYGRFRSYPKKGHGDIHTVDPTTYPYDPEKDQQIPHGHPGQDTTSHEAGDFLTSPGKWAHPAKKLPFTSPISGTVTCEHKPGSDKCEGSQWNTFGVLSCDGRHTVQFLHASRIDVHDGQPVKRGDHLGVTGGFAPPPDCPTCPGKQDQVGVHLHVQELSKRKDGKEVLIDPNSSGPLVDPPPCDPWPCPLIGPPPGPAAFYENRGAMSVPPGSVPLNGRVKKQTTDFSRNLEIRSAANKDELFEIWFATGDNRAAERYKQWDTKNRAATNAAKDPPDPAYRRLAVAASDSVGGYFDALTASMERYRGAESAGDRAWTARHFTAMQLYLRRLAEALRRDATAMQQDAELLPRDDTASQAELHGARQQAREKLRRMGLAAVDFKALRAAGIPEGSARETMYRVLAYPQESVDGTRVNPEEGYTDLSPMPERSLRATLLDSAAEQRTWADEAEQIAALPPGDDTGVASTSGLMQAYIVGNPHDKQETVDLFIRPISIPPDWKLSVVNAEQMASEGQKAPDRGKQPQFPVSEVEAGKHYAVTLPAKGELKVASVLVPFGEVGARTTARWAVEGKIGNELIGGMVHEMNVPYVIADLKLPPVGSKEEEEEQPPAKRIPLRVFVIAAAAVLLVLVIALFLILRRRRRAPTV